MHASTKQHATARVAVPTCNREPINVDVWGIDDERCTAGGRGADGGGGGAAETDEVDVNIDATPTLTLMSALCLSSYDL